MINSWNCFYQATQGKSGHSSGTWLVVVAAAVVEWLIVLKE